MFSFKRFLVEDTVSSTEQVLYNTYSDYFTTLSPEELDSLTYYVGIESNLNSMGHYNINKLLRNWESSFLSFKSVDRITSKELNLNIPLSQRIKIIDSILKRAPGLSEPTWIYRGIDKSIWDKIRNLGSVFEPGFISATLRSSTAKKFGGGYMVKALLKKGFKGSIFVPALFENQYLKDNNEMELIIKRNMYYNFIKDVDDKVIEISISPS